MPDSYLFNAGEALFREGSDAKALYILKSGRVSIRKSIDGGKWVEIAQVGTNQVVGELPFFDGRTRSADAVALQNVEAIMISYDSLRPIYEPSPEYLKKIMVGLASRLRDADEVIRELKAKLGEQGDPAIGDPGESLTKKVLKMTE
jgi:CRP-like cAMP-binding protein